MAYFRLQFDSSNLLRKISDAPGAVRIRVYTQGGSHVFLDDLKYQAVLFRLAVAHNNVPLNRLEFHAKEELGPVDKHESSYKLIRCEVRPVNKLQI